MSRAARTTSQPTTFRRACVRYTGRVQGVGFRYTTVNIARRFDVAGYVQNLPDGGVQVVVEGSASQIRAFLATLHDEMSHHIDHEDRADQNATGELGRPGDPDTFTVHY